VTDNTGIPPTGSGKMFALIERIWSRYNPDDEPEAGWSRADQDVMDLLGWNHTLYNLSHPSEDDKEARDIIRQSAALIRPQAGEVVFYLRVGGEATHLTTRAGIGTEPHDALTKAIEALCAEREDAAKCPIHTSLPPEQVGEGEAERLAHVIDRDRYIVAAALQDINGVLHSYNHLAEPGRGSYAWDDDRYQAEFGNALDALKRALAPLSLMAADKSDCTTDPEKVAAARKAGKEWYVALCLASTIEAQSVKTGTGLISEADDSVTGNAGTP